jgi:hypothetical protein
MSGDGLRRLRDLPLAFALLVTAVAVSWVAIVLFVMLLAGLVLVPALGLGLPVLDGALRATRSLADMYRREAARLLGEPVAAEYV